MFIVLTPPQCALAGEVGLVGDPVDVVTGAVVDTFRDCRLAGPVVLEWRRVYDSRWHRDDRGLGLGFRHAFEHWLVFDLDGITYRDPRGGQTYFPHLAVDGDSRAAAGRRLVRRDERTYVLSEHGKPTLSFHREPRSYEAALVELAQRDDQGHDVRVAFHYGPGLRLEKILAPRDESLRVEWDAAGHIIAVWHRRADGERKALIRYRYEGQHLVGGTDAYGHSFQLAYDREGRLARRVDRTGYAFTFEYDREGRCISSAGEDGLHSVQLTYNPLALETRVLDGNGGEWVYQYLPNGPVVFITDPYGGVRHWRVAPDGRVLAEVDEKNAETTFRFDAAGAPIARITPKGDVVPLPDDASRSPRPHRVPGRPIEWELGDLWDLQLKLPDPHELPLDVPAEARTAFITSVSLERGTLASEHDEQGLELAQKAEDGRQRTFGYNPNGLLRRRTDLDGGTYRYEHKSWNQLAREIDPAGNEVTYEWSATNELAAVVDAAGVRTEYVYDLKDRIVEVRRGGPIHERYAYDAGGNVVERRDANGEVLLELKYDRRGCVIERKLASGEEHTYRYDAKARPIAARSLRHACTFAYDAAGRRIEDKRDGRGVEHRYADGKLAETRILDRFRTEYHHLPGGSVVVVDPTGTTHRIRSHGRGIYTRDFGNGVSETTQYHPRGGRVLSRTTWTKEGVRQQRLYRYSGEGDLVEVVDSERGTTRHVHDAAHRLQETHHPDGRVDRYEYNRAGSLFRSPTLDGTVGQLNQLRHANGDQLEYDHRHNVKTRVGPRGAGHFDRDSRDQLVAFFWESPDGSQRWGWDADYDPLGRRIRKSPGYRDNFVFYWDTDRLAAEILPDGRCRVFVYADGFAMTPMLFVEYESVDADPSTGKRYYVLADQRGCPDRILDDAGVIVWQARLDPYGTAHVEVGLDFHQPLRFPGHYHDPELGLHYNRFRYYSPELGRYLESDPIGQGGGLNVYAYTTNPLTRVDVRGLDECDGTRPHPDSEEEPPPRQHPPEVPAGHGDDAASPRPKTLAEMSDAELQEHCDRRARELREVFANADADGEKNTTLAVGVMEGAEGRRTVVTTSADNQRLHPEVERALQPGEQFRPTEPIIERGPRRDNPDYDPNGPVDPRNNPRTVTDPVIRDPSTGETQPYQRAVRGDPPEGTIHHAEQRMERAAGDDETLLAQAPTRSCCSGCQQNLGPEGLSRIPPHLRGQ